MSNLETSNIISCYVISQPLTFSWIYWTCVLVPFPLQTENKHFDEPATMMQNKVVVAKLNSIDF